VPSGTPGRQPIRPSPRSQNLEKRLFASSKAASVGDLFRTVPESSRYPPVETAPEARQMPEMSSGAQECPQLIIGYPGLIPAPRFPRLALHHHQKYATNNQHSKAHRRRSDE
jgi:hypothetical protein